VPYRPYHEEGARRLIDNQLSHRRAGVLCHRMMTISTVSTGRGPPERCRAVMPRDRLADPDRPAATITDASTGSMLGSTSRWSVP